jgi:hypothetical protein
MPDVTVKLTLGSVSFEVTGPQKYVDKKFEQLVTRFLATRIAVAASSETGKPVPTLEKSGKKQSAAEFLKKSRAKNQYDRALLLGYYLERSGAESFTSSEIVKLGREAKQPFANASDAIAKLSARGLMMSAGNKEGTRAYALTASGEAEVEGMLENKE